jgi:alkylhydroperoxidase family enzyme
VKSARPTPLRELPNEFKGIEAKAEQALGFLPNSVLTMAKRPELMKLAFDLANYMISPSCKIKPELARMVSYITSYGSGCRYCQAHTSYGATQIGIAAAKVAALWQFASSNLFDERERAALSFAFAAGQVPNAVEESHYDELGRYFSEAEIIDLVGIVSIMGFYNRWNDTMGTKLEDKPTLHSKTTLLASGWTIGRHGG